MNRQVRAFVVVVVAGAVLVSVAAASREWRVFAKASGSDVFAVARATGTAAHPRALELRVDATPTQTARGPWRVTCTARSKGARTTFGTAAGTTPFTRPLPIPLAGADSCVVSAKSQLGLGGTLRIYLLQK
jgi:hypothetical protein